MLMIRDLPPTTTMMNRPTVCIHTSNAYPPKPLEFQMLNSETRLPRAQRKLISRPLRPGVPFETCCLSDMPTHVLYRTHSISSITSAAQSAH